ncbi:hypothetical protein SDC9_189956 [bioreactor metagenome]|uniref:Uncharacterized protein n=1 Tax=bioreactor metagenome TaxID=1076179 RepID=A0A645HW31_9ZZZZ
MFKCISDQISHITFFPFFRHRGKPRKVTAFQYGIAEFDIKGKKLHKGRDSILVIQNKGILVLVFFFKIEIHKYIRIMETLSP